jgi:hypothetical protein
MNESSINLIGARHFSPCASLAAIGIKLRQLDLFRPIRETVAIAQKTVTYTPIDKLYDGFVTILAGAHGMVEVNTRLRSDVALQQAFGRTACAEQSVVQDTLDACTPTNVTQLQQALDVIYRQHSQGYRHDYIHDWQILDADMSGMPCGKKAAFASRGYFAKQRNRRGRQLGRVVASRYDEIVVDRLFAGTTQLTSALQPLLEAAEQTLALDRAKRQRTILRVDAGGGSLADVNWVLRRGYQFHGKDYSGARARTLAESVSDWVTDPRLPERQVGWVTLKPTKYARAVRRIAVRCRKKNGQWGVGVLISTLTPYAVLHLTGQSASRLTDDQAVLLAYVYFYDQRGGGVETAFKGDKAGLGLAKRNKKRFEAQQIVLLLGALAHNVIVWARRWLAPRLPKVAGYGMLRMVRDVFHVSGTIQVDAMGHIVQLVLNQAAPLAQGLVDALAILLAPAHVAVSLGET